MGRADRSTLNTGLVAAGIILLSYAVLGNYVALPGYIRFLERGGTSPAGNTFDLAVLVGAAKTILWMYSFQLGVLALALAYSSKERLHTKYLGAAALVWLAVWSWPSLPAPGAWFYILFGGLIMASIVGVLLQTRQGTGNRLSRSLLLGSTLFFAVATWEVCGLGSTGRMLHPEQAAKPLAHNILVTQSSKLMLEFVLAWGLLCLGLLSARRQART